MTQFFNRNHLNTRLSAIGLLLLLQITSLYGMDARVKIRSLGIENGLSSHITTSITQDDIGYLWVGTDDGLHRYDGTNFQVHRNDPGDSLSISDTRVTVLLANTHIRVPELWVGTRNGLNHLNLQTGVFTNYFHQLDDPGSLSNPIINSLAADELGDIWVGTENGLNLLTSENRDEGVFIRLLTSDDVDKPGRDNFIRKVVAGPAVGKNRQLWVGTRNGLKIINYFDNGNIEINQHDLDKRDIANNHNDVRGIFIKRAKSGVFLYVGTEAGELFKLNVFGTNVEPQKIWSFDNFIRDVEVDGFDRIWVATYGEGLFQFTDRAGELIQLATFEGQANLKNSLSNSHISDIHIDKSGIIWVATDNGLNAVLEPVYGFSTLQHHPDNANSLIGPSIRSIYESSGDILWVGTVASGLTRIDRKTGEYKHYIHSGDDQSSLSTNSITTILEDKQGVMWFGTWEGGLHKLNSDGETFTRYQHDPENSGSIPSNIVQGLLEDNNGAIWLNTGGGLSRFNRESDSFVNYIHNPQVSTSISGGDLQSKAMYLDDRNRLWTGSYGGGLNRIDLNRFENLDPETAEFEHFREIFGDNQSISNNLILSITGGKRGENSVVWIGTFSGGLTCIEMKHENGIEKYRYRRYSEADGLSDNVIFGIEEDQRHNLWLSTGEGLSRFNPQTEHFTNYYVEDGLPANSFFWGASFQSKSGEMFFGGTEGLVNFYPGSIIGRRLIPPNISITDVKLMNRPFSHRPRDYNMAGLNIDYSQNLLTIDWALFDYINPSKNRYHYQLEGLHETWVSTESKSSATFTNLPGGHYSFHVKGANYNGFESDHVATLDFYIKPPIWQTLVFRITLVLGLIGILYFIMGLRTRIIAERNRSLKETNEELNLLIKEREKAEERTRHSLEEKEVLLREIYHRTKNNMSVIISLLNLQASNIGEPKITEMFDEIKGRIYAMSLVHEQLMKNKDLSVIALNGYTRQLIGNLIRSYRGVSARVLSKIDIKAIDVSIDTAVPLGLVLNEIITNSMKYAFPDERAGVITIEARFRGKQLYLKICDDGIGFTPQENSKNSKSLGMRIIRTVVVDQLGGDIILSSDGGTCYEIFLNDIELVRRV